MSEAPAILEFAMTQQDVADAIVDWLVEYRGLAPGQYRQDVTMKSGPPNVVFHVALEKCDE